MEDGIEIAKFDVLDRDAATALASERGAFDIIANVAGFVHHGTILDCAEDDFDFSMNLNVKAMYRIVRAFLPAMLEAGGGSIVNMSSVCSSVKGIPNRFIYGTSKAAVIGLTRSIAADFVGHGRFAAMRFAQGRSNPPLSIIGFRSVRRSDPGKKRLHRPPAHGTPRNGRGDRSPCRPSRKR